VPTFDIPYGRGTLTFRLQAGLTVEVVAPRDVPPASNPLGVVEKALATPVGGTRLESFRTARSAAIAINDKTRPVPHAHLLPPLLRRLKDLGIPPQATRLVIATGLHPRMSPEEFPHVLPQDLIARYPVMCHDADDEENLVYLGTSSRGTPIWVNRSFAEADLRIVVGNIEPHQFEGFSGGVKTAAIGLGGRRTIDRNHAMVVDPRASLGRYADNPARQDVEEIGRRIGVHFALNAVLNWRKEIVTALAGEPRAVMEAGIPLSRQVCQVPVTSPFDLVIASPGGLPKDLNFYQSQKALAHASRVTRDGGTVILVAACPEGCGDPAYETWISNMHSHEEVLARFPQEEFRVGPHKAFLVARDAVRVRVILVSEMEPEQVRRLLLTPARDLHHALEIAARTLPSDARVGVMPRASSTIPYI